MMLMNMINIGQHDRNRQKGAQYYFYHFFLMIYQNGFESL